MDPNQERRDKCKMCKGWLPKRKSKFCTDRCARRFQRLKAASRDPSVRAKREDQASFFRAVADEWPVEDSAEEQRVAHTLAETGTCLPLKRNNRIVLLGRPAQEGERTVYERKREQDKIDLVQARRAETEKKLDAEKEARRIRRCAKRRRIAA